MNLNEYRLDELYTMDSGISTSKGQAGHGAPFVSFKDIFNNSILPDELEEKMDTTKIEQEKYSVRKGDVFLTRTSETINELAMSSVALKDYPNATFSGFAKRLRPIDNNIIYDKFMAFFLRSKYFRKIIDCKAVMTLRASFNEDIFSYINVMIPDYDHQLRCGDLLYALEKKIRNNNKINKELEKIAKIIYNYWFLQFEFPNKDGKPYKSSGGKLVWNEELKRDIPEDWIIKDVNSIAELISGYSFSSDTYCDSGKYKLYTIKNVQDGNIISKVDNYIKELPQNMPDECILCEGDMIMSLTGNVGRIGIVYEKNALLNQRVLKIVPKEDKKAYCYMLFRDNYMKYKLEKISGGTSQKNLSPIAMGNLKIAIPEKRIVEKYCDIINPYINMIVNNMSENMKLQELKDYILPLLMNGQVGFKK